VKDLRLMVKRFQQLMKVDDLGATFLVELPVLCPTEEGMP